MSAFKIPPWQRPEIRAWLEHHTDEFDIIAWARLDQAVRQMRDMSELAEWAREH